MQIGENVQMKNQKEILLNNAKNLSLEEIKSAGSNAVVVDMMELINDITSSSGTYEELAKIFKAKLQKGYKRIDIVADCYRSLKLFKNGVDGNQTDEIIIRSVQSRVHPGFKTTLLKNRENKARMVEFIFEYMQIKTLQCV